MYEKHNFKDGDCLCAHHLNKMEEGICAAVTCDSARVGQCLAVKEVDENGKPILWEAKDFSATGGSLYIAVNNGYIQYSTDGEKWENIIAVAELKGVPGATGEQGDPGKDGFSPSIAVEEIEGGHRLIITNAEGYFPVDIMDGKQGEKGDPGENAELPESIGNMTITGTFKAEGEAWLPMLAIPGEIESEYTVISERRFMYFGDKPTSGLSLTDEKGGSVMVRGVQTPSGTDSTLDVYVASKGYVDSAIGGAIGGSY